MRELGGRAGRRLAVLVALAATVPAGAAAQEPSADPEGPIIVIDLPTEGTIYRRWGSDRVRFRCEPAPGGPAIERCDGSEPNGTPLWEVGPAGRFRVWATTEDGAVHERTVTYRLDGSAPAPRFLHPQPRQEYPVGSDLRFEVLCDDGPGGSGVEECRASARHGGVTYDEIDPWIGGYWTIRIDTRDAVGNRHWVENWVWIDDPRCGGERITVDLAHGDAPTDGDDVIVGTGTSETIRGGRGDDVICGAEGLDTLIGGPGDDHLIGARSTDVLLGGPGDDHLVGDRGPDVGRGGPGRDVLEGRWGDDRLDGGPGPDRLLGGPGRDQCDGHRGSDVHDRCELRFRFP